MMKENTSMLVDVQNCAKLLTETPWSFLCNDKLHGLDGLLKQESSRTYLATMNQKIWTRMHWFPCVVLPCSTDITTPWIADISTNLDPFLAQIRVSGPRRHTWSTARVETLRRSSSESSQRSRFPVRPSSMLQQERPLESQISRLILTLFARGFVCPDRLNTLDRRPGPKSLRSAGLKGRFWIWVSSAAGVAHLFLWISWHPLALFACGFVSMHGKFVFNKIHEKLDWFLEN